MIYECPSSLKNKRLIALDIETTGLSIKFNTIIEMGIIEVDGGVVKTRYTKLFGGGHSSMYLVRKIHKIKDCERVGRPTFKDCAEKISSYLSDSWIVTHNGNRFDLPMINQKLQDCGLSIQNYKSIDTFAIAKKIGHESNSLERLCREYGIVYGGVDGGNSHRGLEDAEATLQLLYCLIKEKSVIID